MDIEETKWSIIHHKVSFAGPDKRKDYDTRKANLDITQMFWITKHTVYNESMEATNANLFSDSNALLKHLGL